MAQTGAPTTLKLAHFEPEAKVWIAGAQSLADQRSHVMLEPVHVLAHGLQAEPGVGRVLGASGVDLRPLRERLETLLASLPRGREAAYLSDAALDLLRRGERLAGQGGASRVRREDLLLALAQETRGALGELWQALRLDVAQVRGHLGQLRGISDKATPSVLVDLVEEARAGRLDPVIGRVDLLRRLVAVLERRTKNHPLLVGEHGVGKRALVHGLAQRVCRGDVPTRLTGARLLAVDAARLVAGTRLRSEVDERVKRVLGGRMDEPDGVLVLFGLDALAGSGPQSAVLAELLAPGGVRLLGTTTPEGWAKLQAQQGALARLFSVLPVEEPSFEETLEMVRGGARRLELHHGVQVGEPAVQAAVELSRRHLRERFSPEAAFDLLDEAAAQKRLATDGMSEEVDVRSSRLESLDAQIATLAGAEDAASRQTRATLQAEADALRAPVEQAKARLEERRAAVLELRSRRAERAAVLVELERARDERAYGRVGELEHGALPEVETRVTEAEARAQSLGLLEEARVVGEEDVASVVAAWTGVPVTKMMEGEAARLGSLEQRLTERVVGQEHAVTALAKAVRRGRVGLRDPKKPIGSFLFLGPSGVGKTELAKALAEALFDDEAALTRLDMSEFMEKHMAQRLIGAPPGYADAEQGGFLTEAVRKRPYSVLLFDEVEKAHQDVFNLLLQLLDDGRLTDGRGRLADFSNTVVLLTSNLGSERILESPPERFESADGLAEMRDTLSQSLRQFFRPEMLNRLDDVLVFRPLGRPLLRLILDKEIRRLSARLAARKVRLTVSTEAADHLVELGYEPALGARPLQRVVVRELADPVAAALVSGGLVEGSEVRLELDPEDPNQGLRVVLG
jgi:ATP-dependent Clp protease ATP-binding subunit ClpB